MKKILLSSVFALAAITANAQLAPGSTAPDFTATDVYGESHSLYADYLDQGKVVLLNISATWCGPCWNYHNTHSLADFYEAYGPNGSDEAMVLYVEGDPSTPVSAIFGEGTGSITWGDWTEGTPYPIIDNGTIANQYQITYFPTLYRICSGGITTELNQLSAANLRDNLSSNCETLVGVPNHVKVLPTDLYICNLEGVTASFEVRNYGNNNITEAVLVLKENGTIIATVNYEGNVEQFSNAVVEFDGLNLNLDANYTVELESINGGAIHYQDYATAEVGEIIISENEVEQVNLEVRVYTDNYPGEASWRIKDSAGNIIASEGPYQGNGNNSGGPDALTTIVHWIEVSESECYTIELLDGYGDGWGYTGGATSGLEVFENGNSIIFVDGSVPFGNDNSGNPLVKAAAFGTSATLDADTFETNTFAMYPNPSNGIVTISATEIVNIDIIDVTGKTVHQAKSLENNSIIDLSSLPKGVYLVKVSGEKTNTTEKLILN